MYPELFKIPFTALTVKSYGLMMVVGFLAAVAVIRHLSRDITSHPRLITNAALYSLIAGVAGARIFFVIHYFDQFRGSPASLFAIWQGGLELLGGFLLAIAVILFYLWYHKLPIRHYLDILAVGLMLALVFGRIGCFLNGCCFGKPTDLPWASRFPYGSFAYRSQIRPSPERDRPLPQLSLPQEYFGYNDETGLYHEDLKPVKYLTTPQKDRVTYGEYRCLPVHPTQLYSCFKAAVLCLVLYLFWRRSKKAEQARDFSQALTKPGSIFALMFVLYAAARFFMEFLRDDNPFEIDSLTISQLMSIGLAVLGCLLMVVFSKVQPERPPASIRNATHQPRLQKTAATR